MFKVKLGLIHVTLLLLLYTSSCLAVSTTYNNVYQSNLGSSLKALTDNIFDRDTYDIVGAGVSLSGTNDLNGDYSIPVGSTWTWELTHIEDELGNTINNQLVSYPITYQGEVGSCLTQWSTGECAEIRGWAVSWNFPCIPEGLYRLRVLFNGSIIGEDNFLPSRHKPFIYDRYSKESIKPKTTSTDLYAEETYVLVSVGGVAGRESQCVIPLKDATIRLSNMITPLPDNAGAHVHFDSNNEIGTGFYIPIFADDILDPDGPETLETVIEGKTDLNGQYLTKYKAGDLGIRETVTIEVKRDATATHTELSLVSENYPLDIKVPSIYNLDIKAPNLVEMKVGGNAGDFKFSFGGSCSHTPTARWTIPSMKSRLVALDAIYKAKFGHRISFNDASLEHGGVIDNYTGTATKPKPGGRESICHVSHRRGVDIDLNSADEGGVKIRTEKYLVNGRDIKRIGYITRIAKLLSLKKIYEVSGNIHYRHSSY